MDDNDSQLHILSGAIRSGKTVVGVAKFIKFLETNQVAPDIPAAMIAPAQKDVLQNIVYPLLLPLYGNSMTLRKTEGEIVLPSGRRIFIWGGEEADAVSRVAGKTLGALLFDEFARLHPDVVSMALSRLSVEGARAWATSNPEGPTHWAKRTFIDRANQPDGYRIKVTEFSPEDNAEHLTREFLETQPHILMAQGRSVYERLWLGHWTASEGAVFPKIEEAVIPAQDVSKSLSTCYGADMGMIHSTAFIRIDRVMDGSMVATDELVLNEGEEMLPTNVLMERFAEWKTGHNLIETATLYMDPSAAPLRAAYQYLDEKKPQLLSRVQLRKMGVRDVVAGIGHLNRLMNIGMLKISDRCGKLLDEMRGYRWNEKAAETTGVEKVIKQADDLCDAFRYGVMGKKVWWTPKQQKDFIQRRALLDSLEEAA